MNQEELSFAFFFEAWDIFREPALAGLIAGALLGFLGVYIVLRRMVFLSAALSQSAGLGVTVAFYAQIYWGLHEAAAYPILGAMGMTLLTALLLALERSPFGARRDSQLGLAYLAGGAGALAIGTRIVQEVHDINSILFGSAVVVLPEDFRLIIWMAAVLFAIHLWWLRGFVLTSFDRDGAQIRGLPVRLLETTLLLTLAAAISICTRVLGALPVFAFSVLPAMAAVRLSANVPRALSIAAVIGGLSGFLGYMVAFRYQLPVGASQTLIAIGFVALSSLTARAKRAISRRQLRAA